MLQKIHIGDADGLIAMLSNNDANHDKAKAIIKKVVAHKEDIFFPSTAIAEAITTLQVRLKNPELAKEVAEMVASSSLGIIPVDAEILAIASSIYNPAGSKKNTMFDATVAATAKKYGTLSLFSFDSWYKSIGLKLLVDTL